MSYDHPEFAGSKLHEKVQKPRDAATLILVRRDDNLPRVLMGQRHAAHAFMPNKFVFPGGRLDPDDAGQELACDLHGTTLEKLQTHMRPKPSAKKARGLAVAAVRETLEEAGLLFGRNRLNEKPDLSPLHFFARAITPPGRTKRFDSRFFVADAAHVSNLDAPLHVGTEELLTLRWLTIDEALGLDLPLITVDILGRLKPYLERGSLPQPGDPVSFQYQRGKTWREEVI
jgi:8-oxo-dGTP pyrophosphatase MutT (NUDIX family)